MSERARRRLERLEKYARPLLEGPREIVVRWVRPDGTIGGERRITFEAHLPAPPDATR